MSDYKIKVNSEAESKEAQELFFELGYGWRGVNPRNSIFIPKKLKEYFIVNYEKTMDMQISGVFDNSETLRTHKEITLPELRDLVVLKRNDMNDATHECMGDKFLVQENRRYEWTFSGWATSGIAMSKLKPIRDKQMTSHNIEQQELKANPKLFLDQTQNYAEIEWDGSFMKQDHWIEVPEGVDCYVGYKSLGCQSDGFDTFYFGKINKHGFVNEVHDDHETPYCNPLRDLIRRGQLVWQRTQDEPFLTPESVVASTHGLARDWMNERINDKNHKQYTTELIERVKVLEREVKRLAEIKATEVANCVPPLSSIAGTIKPKPDLSPQEDALVGVNATLAERQSQYGSFEDVAAVTQDLLSVLKRTGYNSLPKPHKEALHMICSKMARLVNGDFNSIDGWHDIGGYAKLIEDIARNETK